MKYERVEEVQTKRDRGKEFPISQYHTKDGWWGNSACTVTKEGSSPDLRGSSVKVGLGSG